jgi:DNA-binding IclR family transcriptional regulator
MPDRTDADDQILALLREGARTQAYLVDETGFSRTHVRNRLQLMEARGWVENLHEQSALWELRTDPDEADGDE